MANSDPRQEGYDAAVAGADRRSPYDGRTQAGKDWYAGYDSHADELEAADMKLSDTPFDASTPVAPSDQPADDEQTPSPEESEKPEKPAEESEKPVDDSELASVGAATDPSVHFLAANRHAHQMAIDDPDSSEAVKDVAREAIAGIDRELRKMGYRA